MVKNKRNKWTKKKKKQSKKRSKKWVLAGQYFSPKICSSFLFLFFPHFGEIKIGGSREKK